jgi:hypothetical protein
VIDMGALRMRWLRLALPSQVGDGRPGPATSTPLRVACPHCTNVDTLSRHCANPRCAWVGCTCGALIYTRRRHRHPRHGTGRDTCHDPSAAV